MSNEYVDRNTIKARLDITGDTLDDALDAAIAAASRALDRRCKRKFYAATETRYFTARSATKLWVPDLLSVTSLKTDQDGDRTYETTWATTDYDLGPFNAALELGEPYAWVHTTPLGAYRFPLLAKAIEIVGSWGYCTLANVPAPIVEAAVILTSRIWKRKDAPLGVLGGGEFEALRIASVDSDVNALIQTYRLLRVA